MEVPMSVNSTTIPQHISLLVAELERWIKAATAHGVSDTDAERYSAFEQTISIQLQVLGWGAVLNTETGRWVPIPDGYTIIHNPPDPYYYPQRRYEMPEIPSRWRTLWEGEQEMHFANWKEAYTFVFVHQAKQQTQLPLKRFCVRPPDTWGGNDYVANTADQALQLHLNYWIALDWITAQQAVHMPLHVFEHCGERGFYCRACQHAPCKYVPEEKWPIPGVAGWIASA
jgi:hypothetical protein